MRTCLFILSFFLVVLLSCNSGQTEKNPKHYTCFYTSNPILIDGKLDEDAWDKIPWTDDFMDIEGANKNNPLFRTRAKLCWDRHYLYIAAELEEPHLWATLKDRDAIIYRDNDFEVFIDPDGDGLNYYEFEINAFGTVFDLFLNAPYNQKGTADIGWDFIGLKSAVDLKGTLNNPVDTDKMWTVEMAFPWKSFTANSGNRPENGDTWRLNFSRVQWKLKIIDRKYIKQTDPASGKVLPENNWVWSPQGEINMHIPQKWGHVRFDGKPKQLQPDMPKLWIWMGAYRLKTSDDWDHTLKKLSRAGIKGVLMAADTTVLKIVIPIAHTYDMQVHAWMWTMNNRDAKPEWLSVNRIGQSLAEQKAYVDYYKFMCPVLPEVRAEIKAKIDQLIKIDGLEGIHMDYIRYVDAILPIGLWEKYDLIQDRILPEYDYGYHPVMRELYIQKFGMDPMFIENAESDPQWLQFRLNRLTETVWSIRDFVNKTDKTITAAVFPTPSMSREMVRQEWNKWELDSYFPMVYHSFYNQDIGWIREVMQENRSVIHGDSRIFCGLFLPALKNGDDLTKAIHAAIEGGADGISFFDYNALSENQLQQIQAYSSPSD